MSPLAASSSTRRVVRLPDRYTRSASSAYGNNSWAIFKACLDAAATKVASPVIAKYLGRLAAADVFTADNAYVMFEALRVDYGMLGPFGDHP
jgi:hypothetical protein